MKINARKHRKIRLQNLIFTLLFLCVIGLLGWLSTRYSLQYDWTAGARHTLSPASTKILELFHGPVKFTAYVREENNVREAIAEEIASFRRHKPEISFSFVNPDTQPDQVRELGISGQNIIRIESQGRSELVMEPTETGITNALQRLAHAKDQHIVFLEGHGERSPNSPANFDLGQFGEELGRKGIKLSMVNLAKIGTIPDNTDVLVLDGPKVNLLPGEVAQITAYVKRGGNLWWMADPGDLHGLAILADQLGLKFLNGTVVDASTRLLGIDDPTFALVSAYPNHPITSGFEVMTVFPTAAALEKSGDSTYDRIPFLSTVQSTWTETGPIEGKIKFDADKEEHQGPLTIGFALTSKENVVSPPEPNANQSTAVAKPKAQRIVVIGDGDFLANAYLGNGGNLNLGLNIINWLSGNDLLINIPAKTATDTTLALSDMAMVLIFVGFLLLLPLSLFTIGAIIWYKRRGR